MTDAQPASGPKVVRDEKGRITPGSSLNPLGKPSLPSWFKDRGPDALKTLMAAATGRAGDDDPPAAKELAKTCADRVRADCAKTVVERIYGKVTDVVEVQGDAAVAVIKRVIVDAEKP